MARRGDRGGRETREAAPFLHQAQGELSVKLYEEGKVSVRLSVIDRDKYRRYFSNLMSLM